MMVVRSTKGCPATIRVLVALEEAQAAYDVAIVDDGFFRARYGLAGPRLEDDGVEVVGAPSALRHLARRYPALAPGGLAGAAAIDVCLEQQGHLARADAAGQRHVLALLDAQLAAGPWLCGELSVADCGATMILGYRARLPLDGLARLDAYLDRLAARPSVLRAKERLP